MNESLLMNQTNNTLKQKPRVRWKSAVLLFFLSLFAIPYYYFGNNIFELDFLLEIFLSVPAALSSLVYVFSSYCVEEMILRGNFSWKKLVTLNLAITILLYFLAFLFILIFFIGLFVEAEQGAFESFTLNVIYFIPIIVIIFSLIPSLILKKYYTEVSKTNMGLLVFYLAAVVVVFVYSWASSQNCNFNRDVECFSDRAEKARDITLCDSFKDSKKRDRCYRNAITGRNLYEKDLVMCDQIKNQEIQNFCYEKVSINIKDKKLLKKTCDKINSAGDDRNKCYTNLARYDNDITVCDKVTGYDKARCVANIAINNNDGLLCEKYLNEKDETSSCYMEMAATYKWSDISICGKTSEEDDDRYYCEVYILENFSDIPSCKEAKKTSYSSLMSQCRRDYHNK